MKVTYKGYTAEEWHDRYQEAREANRAMLEQLEQSNRLNGELRDALEYIAMTSTKDADRIKAYAQVILNRKPEVKPKGERKRCSAVVASDFVCGEYLPCKDHPTADLKRKEMPPIDGPQPIGRCKQCGFPIYTEVGYCGGCIRS